MPKIKKARLILILLSLIGAGAILSSGTAKNAIVSFFSRPIPTYTYKIVNSWPHDNTSFTQGLVIKNGVLYESAGLNGSSSLRIVELMSLAEGSCRIPHAFGPALKPLQTVLPSAPVLEKKRALSVIIEPSLEKVIAARSRPVHWSVQYHGRVQG